MQQTNCLLLLLLAVLAHSLTDVDYETNVAKRLTEFSAITYESESSILNWNCDLCKSVPFSEPRVVSNGSIFGLVGYCPVCHKIVVAFRGSVDTANWITNLKTTRTDYPLCSGCSVHVGFNQGYNSVHPQVEQHIKYFRNKYPAAPVMVTGHSLGGALAVLSAVKLQTSHGIVDLVYTQGQPRVGNDKLGAFTSKILPNFFRIVHYADEVPHIPQSALGFKHGGYEVWYERGMQRILDICPSEDKKCSNQLNILQVTSADHKIVLYLQLKVGTSLKEKFLTHVFLRWLRFLSGYRSFDLDLATMQEQDRQIKQAIKAHRQQSSPLIQLNS